MDDVVPVDAPSVLERQRMGQPWVGDAFDVAKAGTARRPGTASASAAALS
ncbi:hypothetical protein ABZ897_58695 [Nonomuraea sp. NPDC046802]